MKRVLLLALTLGCASQRAEQKPADDQKPAAAPASNSVPVTTPVEPALLAASTTTHTVKGGEVITLGDATVKVTRVTYVNQPCPKDVQCVHSGVVKSVGFEVDRAGAHEEGFVAEGVTRSLLGVVLQVISVQEGPQAQVDVALVR